MCAQVIAPDPATGAVLRDVPMARNDSWSPLGVVASIAAYTDGDGWLDALRTRLSAQRDLLVELLAEHLPDARMRPLEATYLAWMDLRAYGHDDPAAVALEQGRVRLSPGHDYQPGLPGHVRLNIATNAERLTELVRRTAKALA
jgi:cystathionine beta-lyase